VVQPDAGDLSPTLSPVNRALMSLEPRRVFMETHGCQMNVHDSERMAGLLAAEGYVPTDDPSHADLIVFNSCSIREKAEQKLLSAVGSVRPYKEARPEMVIAVGGCVAEEQGDRILKRAPHADIVFGPDHLGQLPEMVRQVEERRARLHRTGFLARTDYQFPAFSAQADVKVSTYVSVMKGCDKFCSFCIVPFTRGREVSRPSEEILDEVRTLARHGAKEVVLLGQTVNSYGRIRRDGHMPFHELLAAVSQVEGIERIRFTSPHPAEFSDEQILAFRDIPKLCPHMHLPVQSGSTRILEFMRRGYSREDYLAIVRRLREVAPGVALTTDIIVGFPGETEADFEDTLSLMDEIRYQASFSFAYSERPGTRAVELDGAVPQPVRMDRLRRLQALQEQHTQTCLQEMLGSTQSVLIEGPSKTNPNRSSGRSGQNRPVHVDGTFLPGILLEAEIVEVLKHSLVARPTQVARESLGGVR
jgi:tRNA-2-methylthio-N6-dimethylallyladenosine synthase